MTARFMLCALALAGCSDPDFPAYNELEGMRVLALRATPPDLLPGQTSTIDALVYGAGRSVEKRWDLCPWPSDPNDGFRCPIESSLWVSAWENAGLGEAPPLSWSDAEQVRLVLPNDRDGLRALCRELTRTLASAASLPPNCDGIWNWTVRLTAPGNARQIEAVKDVRILLSEGAPPNQNPTIEALTLQNTEEPLEGSSLSADSEHAVRAHVATSEAESYLPAPVPGQTPSDVTERTEALSFTWFVDHGSTDRVRRTFKQGLEPLEEASTNRWAILRGAAEAELFVVVRDDRGGVGFAHARVRIED